MNDLSSIQNLAGPSGLDSARRLQEMLQAARPEAPGAVGETSFSEMLGELLENVDQAQKEADVSIQRLAQGESVSMQDVVLRMEEAELTFRLMNQIRDKLISAYKEVMSMQG